nr:hypothetical protein [Tanacetum cinerariifolium]
MCNMVGQYIQRKEEEKQIEEEQAAKAQNWKLLVCYDDDDDEERSFSLKDNIISGLPLWAAITPSLSTEEPDNSLSMGDEHLDTILATESNEFIKSSVESLVPIPSESEGIPDNMCDVFQKINLRISTILMMVLLRLMTIPSLLTTSNDILREKLLNINLFIAIIEALNDNPTPSSDFMTKSSSTSLNSLLEETSTFDNSLPEFETFCFDLEEIKISSGNTTTHSDSSLYDSFIFDLSINPFPPADRSDFYEFVDELTHIISSPEYDCFFFKIEPNSGDFTMDVVEDTFPTREPRVHNALPTHPTLQLNLDFILSSKSLFTYVVWIFLPFLSYSVAHQYLLSLGNEDTIFDPGICNYHIYSFRLDVSHRSGTFIKFKVLNESPMEISFSTCSPMNQ